MNAKHLTERGREKGEKEGKNTRKIPQFTSFLVLVRFNEEDDDKKMKHKTAHDDDDDDDKQTNTSVPSLHCSQCLEHI